MTTEAPSIAFALRGKQVEIVKIRDIAIKPRQRKVDINNKAFVEHIDNLAASIKRAGLLHPITLEDTSNELIAGFCRIQAFLKLGYEEIPAVRRSQLSDLDKKVMELEENLQRLSLEWWERDAAIAAIDQIQRELAEARGETWTQAKTAEAVGVSVGTVNQAIQVTDAIQIKPELKNMGGLVSALNAIKTDKKLQERKEQLQRKEEGKIRTYPAQIIVGDALELIKQVPDASFDAVITNFPFGVELKLGKQMKEVYKDEEDYIVKLVRAVTHDCYRVLKPDSWMLAFFDVRKITYSNKQREIARKAISVFDRAVHTGSLSESERAALEELTAESLGLTFWMEEAGFDYIQLLPCIWAKPNKTQGRIGDPNKGFIMAYEAFVLAGKGEPLLMKRGLPNLFIYETLTGNERDIDVQMPADLCTRLVEIVAMGGARILDPFAGSGAVGEGALNNQCEFLGFELDPERAEVGNLRLREHVHAKSSVGS